MLRPRSERFLFLLHGDNVMTSPGCWKTFGHQTSNNHQPEKKRKMLSDLFAPGGLPSTPVERKKTKKFE
jgi:hypothetical protein